MDFISSDLFELIKNEKNTYNALYSYFTKDPSLAPLCVEESNCIYRLILLYSINNYNVELEEPDYTAISKDNLIDDCLKNLGLYINLISSKSSDNLSIINKLINVKIDFIKYLNSKDEKRSLKLTLTELSKYNGKNNNPAYVAVNGNIYDVTNSPLWSDSVHFGLTAGKDVTNDINNCHSNVADVLSKLPKVGTIRENINE